MRADRLLGLLMLLQRRGRMTARDIAAELEVSERTVYRDVYALRVAGIPVDTVAGPGGGIELYGDWRSDLTGLTTAEASALFSLSTAGPIADLGRSSDLQQALRKLAAALPDDLRPAEERFRSRLHVDPVPFGHAGTPAPLLRDLYRAVMDDRRVRLRLRRGFDTLVDRTGSPLGLVAKATDWYLIWTPDGARIVADRIATIVSVRRSRGTAQRPPDFDLAAFWEHWSHTIDRARVQYRAVLSVPRRHLPWVRRRLGEGMELTTSGDDLVQLTVAFHSIEEARISLLALGAAVEVIGPRALRLAIADAARHVAAVYPE
jgi:predicted DNA-binding transcriptional regulator YafY